MPVPAKTYATSRFRQLTGAVLLFLLAAPSLFARGPGPALRIPLDSLGYQPQTTQFLLAGGSMLTVDYVDGRHLLLTFGVHKLMERIADDPPGDDDRIVEAVLLEVPSGRVLARTDWRLHDNGQYLWGLGHGRFLLRVRDTMTTFAPLANLASGQPFLERPLLTTTRHIGALLLSPESDLLIVESVERTPPVPPPATPLFGPTPKPTPTPRGRPGDSNPVALSFYRLSFLGKDGDEVRPALAGVAHSVDFGEVAATGAGHVAIVDEGRLHWGFNFQPYMGNARELASFDSSCRPTPRFVSSSEFVAFGCHGGMNARVLGGFNMRGEEMWEQSLDGDFAATWLTFAPSSGRFALGRVLGEGIADQTQPIPAAAFTGQSVVVYQMESGKQLLHVDCSPIERAGQNFALSPDGMNLAVIREGAIEIYDLPPLSPKDLAEVKEARALVPEESVLPIQFSAPSQAPATAGVSPSESNAASPPATSASPDVPKAASVPHSTPAPQPPASSAPAGDTEQEQPHKPPTLYTLPDDPAKETK
ncbi:MAG: hypothetical protein ABI380_14935 [Edaphobacter sp.]